MTWLLKVFGIFTGFIDKITPQLRSEIESALDKWEAKAKETKNPYDDILVQLVKGLFGFGL
jgi:hypothetical protein